MVIIDYIFWFIAIFLHRKQYFFFIKKMLNLRNYLHTSIDAYPRHTALVCVLKLVITKSCHQKVLLFFFHHQKLQMFLSVLLDTKWQLKGIERKLFACMLCGLVHIYLFWVVCSMHTCRRTHMFVAVRTYVCSTLTKK